MGRSSDITAFTKIRIIDLHKQGRNQQYIASYLKCSQSSVSRAIKQYFNAGYFENNRLNSGRKPKTTPRDDRKLKSIAKKHRFRSVRYLHRKWKEHGVDVCKSTTLRRLHKLGFHSRVPKIKPLLTIKQKRERVKWCKQRLLWGLEDWKKVLFSDESLFCVSYGDQGVRVWRMKQEAFHKECMKRSVKFAASVMVWACMTANGPGRLCITYERINSEIYQEILEYFMIPSSEDLCDDDFIFQHDLASCHRSVSTQNWLRQHQINVLPWPANSPDLNPIENLWGIMKKRLQNIAPKNKVDLISSIKSIWSCLDRKHCEPLVTSLPNRVRAVIKCKGDATKY